MTTINMQYWLGANERTHVLPTCPSARPLPCSTRKTCVPKLTQPSPSACTFKMPLPKAEAGNFSPKPFKEYTELTCRSIHWVTIIRPMK